MAEVNASERRDGVVLDFEYESYVLDPENAKEIGEELIQEAEKLEVE